MGKKIDLPRGDIEKLIDSWIHSERDRRLLHRRLIDGIRLEPLSMEFDLSVTQVKRIVYRGTETLLSKCW